jgi:hypothetical protein
MSDIDTTSRSVLLGYSVLYILNALYCGYESTALLIGPCGKGDFSTGSSQRGFFFLLFFCGNVSRFAWLIAYSSSDVIDETPDTAGIYSMTTYLRQVPELFFLAAYSFLGAYFGQFKMSLTSSPSSWLYHTVAIRSISMILLFGCLVMSTLGGVSPLYVYAFLAILYALTLITVVWSCTGVMNQLPNSISTKSKIMGRLLPLLSVAMFSLIGGGTLNIVAWGQHWYLGFPKNHEMMFDFFYFLLFEGLPSTAVLVILFRLKPIRKHLSGSENTRLIPSPAQKQRTVDYHATDGAADTAL